MKLIRLTYSYLERMNVFVFIATIRLIINRIKDVPPGALTPNPPVANMESQLGSVEAAAEAAKFGDKNAINHRKDQSAIMLSMIVQQGGTVIGSNFNSTQIQELGFRLAKTPTPAPAHPANRIGLPRRLPEGRTGSPRTSQSARQPRPPACVPIGRPSSSTPTPPAPAGQAPRLRVHSPHPAASRRLPEVA